MRTKLVLLPGMDGTGKFFARLTGAIGEKARTMVVAYPPNGTDTYADHVRRIANEIGSEDCVLVGESFGGPLAVMLAAELPYRVRGVVLAATFLQSPWRSWLMRIGARLPLSFTPAPILRRSLIGERDDPELAAGIATIVGGMPWQVSAQRLREIAKVDARDKFASLKCPVRVLHGTGDRLVSHQPIEAAVREKIGAEMMLFNAPHMLLQTEVQASAEAILDFLKRIERGS